MEIESDAEVYDDDLMEDVSRPTALQPLSIIDPKNILKSSTLIISYSILKLPMSFVVITFVLFVYSDIIQHFYFLF